MVIVLHLLKYKFQICVCLLLSELSLNLCYDLFSTFKKDAAFLTIKVHVPISIEVDVCQNFFQLSLLQFLPEQCLCGLLQLLKGDPSITITVKLREAERNAEVMKR